MSYKYEILVNKSDEISQRLLRQVVFEIKRLVKVLMQFLTRLELKKLMGAAAVLLGISFSNQSSAQNFTPSVENPFGLVAVTDIAFPSFADLDGDGDLDMIAGEYSGNLKYFENIGTTDSPLFTDPVINPFGLTSTELFAIPSFVDLDNDGDMDLLVGEYYGDMQYFENTGISTDPQFAAPTENPFGLLHTYYVAYTAFADIDEDGDQDLLVGEIYGAMQYYQNTGTSSDPQFDAPLQNPFGLVSTYEIACPAFADLDKDGDFDLLVGEYLGSFQYFENTGTSANPQYTAPIENPFGLVSVNEYSFPAFADLDNDGDLDLMAGEYSTGSFIYFENTPESAIDHIKYDQEIVLYPIPVIDFLNIESEYPVERAEIFNITGKLEKIVNITNNKISLQNLNRGLYTVNLYFSSGNYVIRKIFKE